MASSSTEHTQPHNNNTHKKMEEEREERSSRALPVETRYIKIDPLTFSDDDLRFPVQLLRAGDVVAFPTETVYGLGANALDAAACSKIFAAKQRPSDNPLIVHVADRAMLARVVQSVPPVLEPVLQRLWPGPLTLLFRRQPAVPDAVTAGLDTVAVRMPSHPVAQALIRLAGTRGAPRTRAFFFCFWRHAHSPVH